MLKNAIIPMRLYIPKALVHLKTCKILVNLIFGTRSKKRERDREKESTFFLHHKLFSHIWNTFQKNMKLEQHHRVTSKQSFFEVGFEFSTSLRNELVLLWCLYKGYLLRDSIRMELDSQCVLHPSEMVWWRGLIFQLSFICHRGLD